MLYYRPPSYVSTRKLIYSTAPITRANYYENSNYMSLLGRVFFLKNLKDNTSLKIRQN